MPSPEPPPFTPDTCEDASLLRKQRLSYKPPDTFEVASLLRGNSLAPSASTLMSKANESTTSLINRTLTTNGLNPNIPYRLSEVEIKCSICLAKMDEQEGNLFTVPGCSHIYHKNCILQWKKQSKKCPCCRGPMPDSLGPTLTELQKLPAEPVLPDMTWDHIIRYVVSFLLGTLVGILLISFSKICFFQ